MNSNLYNIIIPSVAVGSFLIFSRYYNQHEKLKKIIINKHNDDKNNKTK